MKGKVQCTCGWSWNKSDSSKKDMYICHECGRDNSNNMQNGGDIPQAQDEEVVYTPPKSQYKRLYGHATDYSLGENLKLRIDPNTGYGYFPPELSTVQQKEVPDSPWNVSRFLFDPIVINASQGIHNAKYDKEGKIIHVPGKDVIEEGRLTDGLSRRERYDAAKNDITNYYKEDLKLNDDEVEKKVDDTMDLVRKMRRTEEMVQKYNAHYKDLQNPEGVFRSAVGFNELLPINSMVGDFKFNPRQAKKAYKMFQKTWRGTSGKEARQNSREELKKAQEAFELAKEQMKEDLPQPDPNYVPEDFANGGILKNGGWLDQYDVAQEGKNLPSVRDLINDTMNRKIQTRREKGKETNIVKKDNTKTVTPKEIKKLTGRQQNELAQKQSEEQAHKDQVFESMQEAYKSPLMSPGYFTPEGMAIGALQGATKLGPDLYEGDYKAAAMDALMALPIAIPAAKTLRNIKTSIAPELRQGLHTAGISDLYKINPWATKIDDAASKIVGEGKNSFIYDPAKSMYHRTFESTPNFLTGYKQIKKPNQLDFSSIIDLRTEEFKNKALQNFKTLTGGKGDDIDLEQFVDYFKKEQGRQNLKWEYQDFLSNINREKYYDTPEWKNVWDDSRDQAEDIFGKIEEQLLQKSFPLGKRLGSGAEGSVYELADDPDKVIKIGNTFKTNSADDLVKSFEDITDDNIARVLRAHQDNRHLIEIMPNLNANPKFSNFTKEQVLGKLEKDAKVLMDKGFQLDVDNINGNFRYNPDKNKVDIYDISKPAAGQTSQNPEAVLRILRDHFNNDYRIPRTHPSYDPNMPTPEFKQGGIIKDDRGQWDHPGEITEIGSNQITMQGVLYPVLGISDTGDTKLMKPGKDYKFKGKKVTEFPMAKNGLRQEQKGLVNLDQLTNFTNYNKPTIGGWLDKY